MTLVDIDDELKKKIDKWVKKQPIDFPTIKNFCDRLIQAKIEELEKEEKERGD